MRLSIIAALALGGCFPAQDKDTSETDADTDTDTDTDTDSDSDSDTEPEPDDTALVILAYKGDWSVPGGSFESLNTGFGAFAPLVGAWGCEMTASYTAVGPGQEGCPDCDWSFETSVAGTETTGDLCEDIFIPGYDVGYSVFTLYSADEMWFASGRLDGWGTNPAYNYVGDGVEYYLGQTLFFHYTYRDYNGWYFMSWNFPDYDYYQVYGDSEAASWARVVRDDAGNPVYYYYYY